MKNLLLFSKSKLYMLVFLVFLSILFSCSKSQENQTEYKPLLYKNGENHTFMYNFDKKEFYLIQFTSKIEIEGDIFFKNFDGKSLKIVNNGELKSYEVGKNGIYGIAKLTGFENKYLIKNNSAQNLETRIYTFDAVFNPDFGNDFEEKVYCKCQLNKLSAVKCDSGGPGSTECKLSIGSPHVLTQSCETKCDTRVSYACCYSD